jgi:FtsZ-interacting cell division protein ZipA
MSTLRWILLVLGVAIIAAIYFMGRRQDRNAGTRREPRLGHRDSDSATPSLPESETSVIANEFDQELVDFDDLIARGLESEVADFRPQKTMPPADPPATPAPSVNRNGSMLLDQELVVLNLFAVASRHFEGEGLYAALHNAGFAWQNDQLFHCQGMKGEYVALNALKPGTFPRSVADFGTHAIALILQLSKVDRPVEAFDEFLNLARQLQSDLEARLCDGQRSSLTNQTIAYLRDEVKQYQFKHR